MAKREALRELQSRLAERLQASRTQGASATWLAVESGGQGFLLPLGEAGEIFSLSALVPVPHTSGWFLGVANLRGGLHGVVDLAGFLGIKSQAANEPGREQSRLVAFNPSLEINCAMLVDRLAGLRSREQLEAHAEDGGPKPGFVGGRYRDEQGRSWQELRLAALAGDEAFLKIVG
ncbi:MAG TPA: chemotaxis protein CheW [Methylibium sp.]